MPRRPGTPCRHPGCSELVEYGELYCKKHKALHPMKARKEDRTPSDEYHNLYSRRWRKASKAYLSRHPLCVRCAEQGKYTKATVVDHIKPHKGNKELFWDHDNWQSLCKECHDKKTYYEDTEHHGFSKVYEYDFSRK